MRKALVYSLLLILLAGHQPVLSRTKDDTRLTKTITRSFQVERTSNIRIVNKYGPVAITTWDKDSVDLKIEITAYGKNDKNVEKLMARVDFDFDQNSRYLLMGTVLDRSSGFFTEVWNNIGDYSKTLLNQNKLKIEYTVVVPASANLEIENKFGDVYLEDYDGKLNVTLSHGNLRAGKINESINLDLSFGSANIKHIREGRLTLKATECEFDDLGNVEIKSSSSEVEVETVRDLKIESSSDRRISINNAGIISGSSNFSKVEVENFEEYMRLDLNYGELRVRNQKPGFTKLEVSGKTTDIILQFDEDNYLNFEYYGKEDKVDLPAGSRMKREELDEKEKTISLKGYIGNKKTETGKVIVKSQNAEVRILTD